jgi:hypothetical protein
MSNEYVSTGALSPPHTFSPPSSNFIKQKTSSLKQKKKKKTQSSKKISKHYLTRMTRDVHHGIEDTDSVEAHREMKKREMTMVNVKDKISMVDKIFGALHRYMKMRGLRLTDVFGILDKDHKGYLRACPPKEPERPAPVMYRMQEIDPISLIFNELEVETWIMFMERGHRKERSMGEDKARRKVDIRITFNEFSKTFKQYLKKRAKDVTNLPRVINYGLSPSPSVSRNYASRRMSSTSSSKTKKEKSNFDMQKQSRANEYKEQIEHNLKTNLIEEKRKKAGLARKLASMTLEAVDVEIDAATSDPVPSANLVTAFEDQHWLEHEEQVEKEYAGLKHHLHHFGSHLTTGASGGDLYFGAYEDEEVKQRLEEEENDLPHKVFSKKKKKTHQYYKEKYDISARRLKTEKEELEHTKAAVLDCEREIRAGRDELKYKHIALRNNEYKVQTLIWILNEIGKHWNDDDSDPSTISMPLSRSFKNSKSQSLTSLNEKGKLVLNSNTKLSTLIDSKLMDISNELPLWSEAFKGEGDSSLSSSKTMSSDESNDLMRKMQAMLRNWGDDGNSSEI